MNREGKRSMKGFTIVELMLAMAFIGVLLLTVAMTVIQIGTIYNKGLSMKELNQSTRSISSDIIRSASEVQMLTLSNDFVKTTAGGRICFGNFSYLWNTVPALEANDSALVRYSGPSSTTRIQLVKVPDAEKIYCLRSPSTGQLANQNIRVDDVQHARELLPGGDYRMGIYRMDIPAATTVTDATLEQSLYTLNYTIGSGRREAMNADQTACLAPDQANSDLVYCNVQDFSIVLRTGSGVN